MLEQEMGDRGVEVGHRRRGAPGRQLEIASLPVEHVEHHGPRVGLDLGRPRGHDLAVDEVDPGDQLIAWIDFVDGRIVRARSTEVAADSRTVVMNVLDWQAGYFELSTGGAIPAVADLDTTITHLLLEHARLRDEAPR